MTMEAAGGPTGGGNVAEPRTPSLMWSVLRNRWRTMVAVVAVVLVGTALFTKSETKIFEATSSVVVQSPPFQSGPNSGPNMATEAAIGGSPAVAQMVVAKEHLNETAEQLLSSLSVHVPVDSNILQFTYASRDPHVAQDRAADFASAYLSFRHNQLARQEITSAAQVTQTIKYQTKRLADLRATFSTLSSQQLSIAQAQANAIASQIGLLQQRLGDINTASNYSGGTLGHTPLPHSPAKPRAVVNMVVALFAGLFLAFGIAAAREYADPRIRGREELASLLGAPILGAIPAGRRVRKTTDKDSIITVHDPQSPAAEGFRRLRSNLLLAAYEGHLGSLLVTGADVARGSTWVATNLAVALSVTGRKVVLVSADLERSNLRSTFGTTAGALIDVLRDSTDVQSAMQEGPVEGLWLLDGRREDAHGSGAQDRTEDLVDPFNARRVITNAALGKVDGILVEAPPISTCVDTAAWAAACDGVLLVCDIRRTRRDEVIAAREHFDRARATVLGAVLLERTGHTIPRGWAGLPSLRRQAKQEPPVLAMAEQTAGQ